MPVATGLLADGRIKDRAEAARLRAVARYVILDTPAEPQFDDIAVLAQQLTGCPFAAVTFVDAERVWLKSAAGFPRHELPRDLALCDIEPDLARALVPDTDLDERCRDRAWIQTVPRAGFYAAEPLRTPDGFTLGHLVVMDTRPRSLSTGAQQSLAALSRQVVAHLELRRTSLCYHTVIDAAGLAVFHLDAQTRLVSVTPTWAKLTGYGSVRSLGEPIRFVVHQDHQEQIDAQLYEVLRTGRLSRMECWIRTLHRTDLPVELFVTPLPSDRGLPPGLVGVLADISERRAREIETQHSQRLESLGRVAAGIAHEINTPIQFIGDNTRFLANVYSDVLRSAESFRQLAVDDVVTGPERQRRADQIAGEIDMADLATEVPLAVQQTLDGVLRVATIVRAMKSLSHPGHQQATVGDINEALTSAVAVARHDIKYHANITLDLADLPPVRCFIADLSQVFLNLLVNAADAVRETGRHGQITIRSRVAEDQVVVEISDTGAGMPPALREKIFEPFFTTKPVGQGTGQGLALARVIVYDKHQGRIDVASTPGIGTTFTIWVPVAGPAEERS